MSFPITAASYITTCEPIALSEVLNLERSTGACVRACVRSRCRLSCGGTLAHRAVTVACGGCGDCLPVARAPRIHVGGDPACWRRSPLTSASRPPGAAVRRPPSTWVILTTRRSRGLKPTTFRPNGARLRTTDGATPEIEVILFSSTILWFGDKSPNLSTIWYDIMNYLHCKNCQVSCQLNLTHRLKLFKRNWNEINGNGKYCHVKRK